MNRLLRHHARRGLIFGLIVFAMLATSIFSGLAPHASAVQAASTASAQAPILGHVPNAAKPDSFSVAGAYFSPGGKVYLAIYDQTGQALYENRWVAATGPMPPFEAGVWNDQVGDTSHYGEIHETFGHLCGAMAMIRALDTVTARWSNWVTIEPNCPPSNAAAVADDLDTTLKLPVGPQEPSAFVVAAGQIVVVDPPLLLVGEADSSPPDVVSVTGLGFTAGRKVYVAIYDQMGARLYPNRWLTAANFYTLESSSAASSQVPVISKTATGTFHISFANLCGGNVMIRAYDATTETWSDWLDVYNNCSSDPAVPTQRNGQVLN